MSDAFVIAGSKPLKLAEFTPDYTVRFFRENKEIGCFDFGASPAIFTGDVDESAKLFVEAVIRMMPIRTA